MTALFVTATGTDAGKTFVTAGLIGHLRAQGFEIDALKPVVSGFDESAPEASDPAILLAALGKPLTRETLDAIAPLRFAAPLAADMAARREGRSLLLHEIAGVCQQRMALASGPLIVEGAGGVMSPIAEKATCLNLISALHLPALLVGGTYLGSISHVLTAVEAMRARAVEIAGIVLNETPGATVTLEDTRTELQAFLPDLPIVAIARDAIDFGPLARALHLTD